MITVEAKNGHKAVEESPIGFSKETVNKILPQLDAHVSSLFMLFHQYQKHHWIVSGPQFRDLHLYLEEAYTEIHKDLDALAERMTILGGLPTSHPVEMHKTAYIDHEPEGMFSIRDMLYNNLQAEQEVIKHIRESVEVSVGIKDWGTERLLKKLLYHAEDRAHHLDHYLERNTLLRDLAQPTVEDREAEGEK